MLRESIEQILGPKIISAVSQAETVESYIVHRERRELSLVDLARGPNLNVEQIATLRSLILDVQSHFFAQKRCLPVPHIRLQFLGGGGTLDLIIGFSCRDWEFRCNNERKGSFFDPVSEPLLSLVKGLFPDYASPNRLSLWRQGAILGLLRKLADIEQ